MTNLTDMLNVRLIDLEGIPADANAWDVAYTNYMGIADSPMLIKGRGVGIDTLAYCMSRVHSEMTVNQNLTVMNELGALIISTSKSAQESK